MVAFRLVVLPWVVVAALAAPAFAQNKAVADALFTEGKRLLAAGEKAKACGKFEASLKELDQLGVRLNLADCYDQLGRLTAAYGEFRKAAVTAEKSGDSRAQFARERFAAVEKRLPQLTIKLAGETPGLAITRDGEPVGEALLDTPLPADPGPHTIAATAPGYKPWSSKVELEEKTASVVEVPVLEKDVVVKGPDEDEPEAPVDEGRGGRGRRLLGLGVGGAGLLSLGVGLVFGMGASGNWSDAQDAGCTDDGSCPTQAGVDLVNDAQGKATLSTVFVAVGIVAIGTGVVLYLTAPKDGAQVAIVPAGAGLSVIGRF
jgi:hypothetical protein